MPTKPCPPITYADLERSALEIQKAAMETSRHLNEIGTVQIGTTLKESLALINTSKTIRPIAGDAAADAYLDNAREKLFRLLGIEA